MEEKQSIDMSRELLVNGVADRLPSARYETAVNSEQGQAALLAQQCSLCFMVCVCPGRCGVSAQHRVAYHLLHRLILVSCLVYSSLSSSSSSLRIKQHANTVKYTR